MTSLSNPTQKQILENSLDIYAPAHGVEILVSEDKATIWINVDGVMVLRIAKIPYLVQNVTDLKWRTE